MPELQRMTTQYLDSEDRIRLAGEVGGADAAPGQAVVMWLTQRLLYRLLPPLLRWLEGQSALPDVSATPLGGAQAEWMHGFAMQAARASLVPQAPVNPEGQSWLVHTVGLEVHPETLRVSFQHEGMPQDQAVSVTLTAQALRQWLSIVHEQCQQAQWPMTAWPQWLAEAGQGVAGTPTQVH